MQAIQSFIRLKYILTCLVKTKNNFTQVISIVFHHLKQFCLVPGFKLLTFWVTISLFGQGSKSENHEILEASFFSAKIFHFGSLNLLFRQQMRDLQRALFVECRASGPHPQSSHRVQGPKTAAASWSRRCTAQTSCSGETNFRVWFYRFGLHMFMMKVWVNSLKQ